MRDVQGNVNAVGGFRVMCSGTQGQEEKAGGEVEWFHRFGKLIQNCGMQRRYRRAGIRLLFGKK
jgi:hypothetical protein